MSLLFRSARRLYGSAAGGEVLQACVVGSGPAGLYTADEVGAARGVCARDRRSAHASAYLRPQLLKRYGDGVRVNVLVGPSAVVGLVQMAAGVVGRRQTSGYRRQPAPHPAQPPTCQQDRLPTPFGLVRSGVAPDHADTKARSASSASSRPRAAA